MLKRTDINDINILEMSLSDDMQIERDYFQSNASVSNSSTDRLKVNLEGRKMLSSFVKSYEISVSTIPVDVVILVILAVIILINVLVLTALLKVSKKLGAKFLLINTLIANLIIPLSSKLPPATIWICIAYGLKDPLTFPCLELITWLVPPFAVVVHGFCSFYLA